MMPNFFISYSRADSPLVQSLVPMLRELYGYERVWFDENLVGGHDWWEEILRQIAACDIFLYLLSNDSLKSDYCQAEYEEARRLQKIILPVNVRARTNLPDNVSRIQIIDLANGVRDIGAMNKLYAAIARLSEQIPQLSPSPLEPQPVSVPAVNGTGVQRGSPRTVITGAGVVFAVLVLLAVIVAFSSIPIPGPGTVTDASSGGGISPDVTRQTIMLAEETSATATIPASTQDFSGAALLVERLGDTLAICANRALDLSTLRIRFVEQAESYMLGDPEVGFPASATTGAGQCWCYRQLGTTGARPPAPAPCNGDNTQEVPNAGQQWHNMSIRFTLDGWDIGICNPRPFNSSSYFCAFDVVE